MVAYPLTALLPDESGLIEVVALASLIAIEIGQYGIHIGIVKPGGYVMIPGVSVG